MGTRLYPLTRDERKLEILAGVPAGTYQQLREFEAKQPTMGENAWYDELFANEHLNALHSFKVFGWGRVAEYRSCCGETTDPKDVQYLLRLQGVDADPTLTEGLCWS